MTGSALCPLCGQAPDNIKPQEIVTTNIHALIQRAPRRSISEKMDWLLELLASRTRGVGFVSDFNVLTDYPLLTARNADEAEWIRNALEGRGLIQRVGTSGALTMTGWERMDKLRQA